MWPFSEWPFSEPAIFAFSQVFMNKLNIKESYMYITATLKILTVFQKTAQPVWISTYLHACCHVLYMIVILIIIIDTKILQFIIYLFIYLMIRQEQAGLQKNTMSPTR